ncbi:hypothetical protein Hanom_Chr03g00234101 [Helianthus anomalus]
MLRKTRSSFGDSAPTFFSQNILQDPEKEICSFDSAHLSALKTSGIFPEGTVFRHLIGISDRTWRLTSGSVLMLFHSPWASNSLSPISSPSFFTSQKLVSVRPCQCSGECCSFLIESRTPTLPSSPFMIFR